MSKQAGRGRYRYRVVWRRGPRRSQVSMSFSFTLLPTVPLFRSRRCPSHSAIHSHFQCLCPPFALLYSPIPSHTSPVSSSTLASSHPVTAAFTGTVARSSDVPFHAFVSPSSPLARRLIHPLVRLFSRFLPSLPALSYTATKLTRSPHLGPTELPSFTLVTPTYETHGVPVSASDPDSSGLAVERSFAP